MPIPNGGLITESNEEYYIGQKSFTVGGTAQSEFPTTFNTTLKDPVAGVNDRNYYLQTSVNNGVTWTNVASEVKTGTTNVIVSGTNASPVNITNSLVRVVLFATAMQDNYGGYAYISLNDVVNNFMVAYVGAGKLIPSVKRTDVIFHAKRGVQEFSYDTLRSCKSQEFTLPPSLSFPIPQDYVNYIRLSWTDDNGVKRIIYPVENLTITPKESPLQDDEYNFVQDSYHSNIQEDSVTEKNWKSTATNTITGLYNQNNINQGYEWWGYGYAYGYGAEYAGYYGRRYGLEPSLVQDNGWFEINKRTNTFSFSSNLVGKTIVVEYVSDGLAYDADTKIPKMIEDAMYAHILHAIISTRDRQPEYVVRRLQKDRSAKLRNAKIRLSNIKIGELTQIMRGKSKVIKH